MGNLNVDGKQSHDRDTFEPCNPGWADEIEQCANDDRSAAMLRAAGDQTRATHPQQAPWVVFEGQETYNTQAEFLTHSCHAATVWRWRVRPPSARVRARFRLSASQRIE